MISRTTLLLLLALSLTAAARAQSRFQWAKNLLHSERDTAYIAKPDGQWTFKVRTNTSGSHLGLHGKQDGTRYSAFLDSQLKTTLSLGASYRGISAALALNPAKIFGKYSDYEINLNAYSNRYGLDVIYARVKSYHGNFKYGDETINIESGQVSQKMLNISGYYAFNYRRFSYPAAFSQSQIQLQSCGSWLIGATGMFGSFKHDDEAAFSAGKLQMRQFAIGGGYAYNWVRDKWLLHGSLIPQAVILANNWNNVGDEREKAVFRFPNMIFAARLGAVRSWNNKFAGITAVINHNSAGWFSKSHIANMKWRARIFFGLRI